MAAKLSSRRAKKLRARLSGEQNHRCCWCGIVTTLEPGHRNSATIEHHIGVADGGTHSWFNLAMACNHCNTTRQDSHPAYDSIHRLDTKAGRRALALRHYQKAFKKRGDIRLLDLMIRSCPCRSE